MYHSSFQYSVFFITSYLLLLYDFQQTALTSVNSINFMMRIWFVLCQMGTFF